MGNYHKLRRRSSWAEYHRAGRSLFLTMDLLHELDGLEELQFALAEGPPLETHVVSFDFPLND